MKLTAATHITCDMQTLLKLTQTPDQHVRWDVRFTDIEYLPKAHPADPQRFRYATRIGFGIGIEGWGETLSRPDQRSTALRFGTDDPKSLIKEGTGCWVYSPDATGVNFSTIYDYKVRYDRVGRAADRIFRLMMIVGTRWSFDRLRLWIERGISPETSLRLWLVKIVLRLTLAGVCLVLGNEHTLPAYGALVGLALLPGRAERLAVVCALFFTTALAMPSLSNDAPVYLCSVFCCLAVWCLSPLTPNAGRANPKRVKR